MSAWLDEALPDPDLISFYIFGGRANWPVQDLGELSAWDVPLNLKKELLAELLINCNDILERLLPHHRVRAHRVNLSLLEVCLDVVNLRTELPQGHHVELPPLGQAT